MKSRIFELRKEALAELVANGTPVSHAGAALGLSADERNDAWTSILADLGWQAHDEKILVADIQKRVAAHYGLHQSVMTSPSRERRLTRPRQVAMYLARHYTPRTLPQLGQLFARDHTSVLHGIRVVQQRRSADPAFDREVAALAEGLAA